MDNINSILTNLAKEAPLIPKDIEKKVKNELESDPIHHELFSEKSEKCVTKDDHLCGKTGNS